MEIGRFCEAGKTGQLTISMPTLEMDFFYS